MALMLLRVFLVGVLAAAADDVPITWWPTSHAVLPCVVPLFEKLQARRPPPPLNEDYHRPKTFTWRRGEEEINSKRVSANGTLEVSKRGRKEGEGIYQCVARQHGGLVLGYPTHLKFASMDKQFAVLPENATARSGQPFLLSCNITSAPPAAVSWLKDDQPLAEDGRHYIFETQLLITDVSKEDEGLYRCMATNSLLGRSRTSHAGQLLVHFGAGDQDIAWLPIHYEANIMASRGTKVVMPCPVVGWPRPRLLWVFTPPDGRKAELEFEGEVLVLRSLEEEQDQGIYTCSVEGYPHLLRTFAVTLTEPPKITVPPSRRDTLRAGTVRFNCTAEGRPEPVITWFKDGQPLELSGRFNLRKSTDEQRTELVISGVTSDDAGVYQCFAKNPAGIDSAWAMLNVTGADAAAPTNVRCWALGDKQIKVAWDKPAGVKKVLAYTLHGTAEGEKAGNSLPGHPIIETEEIVSVKSLFVPYRFQVRAYVGGASDLSKPATCQGQGVPIRMAKVGKDQVIVSWKHFAKDYPGVVQWILQTKNEANEERNITLDGTVYNYTLNAPQSSPLKVRVLGSLSESWLPQDLSLVPWSSTEDAGADLDAGDVTAIPEQLQVTDLSAREFTVTWRCADADRYVFMVCLKGEDTDQVCEERKETSATFKGLFPGSVYRVLVQARVPNRVLGGPFSEAFTVITPMDSSSRFKNLTASHVNATTIVVRWNGEPGQYTVYFNDKLQLPVTNWDSVETYNCSVMIPVIDPAQKTFILVEGYDPLEHSKIETVPPFYTKEKKTTESPQVSDELQHEYTGSGVMVWWSADGPRVVSYAQNITTPLEMWTNLSVTEKKVVIPVNQSLPTYVLVSKEKNGRGQMLTIDPRPPKTEEQPSSGWVTGFGIGLGVLVLILMAVAAVCIWRRRKRALSPIRSRQRNLESNEDNVEEAEMKAVGGASARRLANGGARGAGEPLLNGHVHITENPTQSKTPNGKMRRGLYEAAFDVSRYEDPETTQETVLDAETSTSFHLLDTSRRPELDLSRSSHEMSTNNSFTKLPDDNMNSELTRSSFQLDNSKIQPTLQPNG